jgi:hypothetical protein
MLLIGASPPNSAVYEECHLLCGSFKAIQYNTPEDGILHSHRRENVKSEYIAVYGRRAEFDRQGANF